MPEDVLNFISSTPPNRNYVIEQLISSDSGYGVVAGRLGLGKTNLLLNFGAGLSRGDDIFELKTKKSKVLYLAFEGGRQNLQDRCRRITDRGLVPDAGQFQIKMLDAFPLLKGKNRDKFRQMIEPFDIILPDPIKWMVGGHYTSPDVVAEFTKEFIGLLRAEGKIAIFSIQIRKRDPRAKIAPGDLFEIKGAADYVEDASFAILLERSELRGKNVPSHLKDKYLSIYFPKHREATKDLTPIEVIYSYERCEFQVV